jgi:hypothetical protein
MHSGSGSTSACGMQRLGADFAQNRRPCRWPPPPSDRRARISKGGGFGRATGQRGTRCSRADRLFDGVDVICPRRRRRRCRDVGLEVASASKSSRFTARLAVHYCLPDDGDIYIVSRDAAAAAAAETAGRRAHSSHFRRTFRGPAANERARCNLCGPLPMRSV